MDRDGEERPRAPERDDAARGAWSRSGGYRAEYEWVEDIDLWLRLAERGRLANLPDVLLRYRLHEESVCHRRHALQRNRHDRLAAAACARFGFPAPEPPAPEESVQDRVIGQREIYLNWCRLAATGATAARP